MKVKVTYTVDLNDVPNEANRLLSKISTAVSDIGTTLEGLEVCDASALAAAQELDGLRKKLFTVDSLMADVEGIIRGYVHTLNNQNTGEEVEKS